MPPLSKTRQNRVSSKEKGKQIEDFPNEFSVFSLPSHTTNTQSQLVGKLTKRNPRKQTKKKFTHTRESIKNHCRPELALDGGVIKVVTFA